MRKIDKRRILSTKYKEWVEGLEKHPKYYSSHKYITDIKMNLLYCQKGLCAYTEEELCDIEQLDIKYWKDGVYTLELDSQNLINGDVEHFDCLLKEDKAYLWDNLFMVNSNINCRVKGTKTVKNILKPDANGYDEYKYLEFDHTINKFLPNVNLSKEDKEDVLEMIETLGINSNAFKRAKQIKSLIEDFELESSLSQPSEYITSWKMTLLNLEEMKNTMSI